MFVPLAQAQDVLSGRRGPCPLILRANAGDWIEITLHNLFEDVYKRQTLTGTKAAISESSSSQSTITVTSGTFSSDISTYTNGLPVVSDGNGNYIIRHLSEVYLNGQSGDDTKGGADVANAVKTLDTALRLVADDGVIYICGQVTIDTDTELNNAVFKRAESYNGSNSSLFYVTSQATLTLSDVVIDGDNIELGKDAYDGYSYAYLIKVYNGSTLKIKDGADLKNNGARAIEVYQSSLDLSLIHI